MKANELRIVDLESSKIVIWRDGSCKLIKYGITWEYENDSDWLITLPFNKCFEKTDIFINLIKP